MNDNAAADELPELSDEDITLLHQICTLANNRNDPPFKALFAAYDQAFLDQGIEQEHDGVVFRLLLRVGETARERGGQTGRVDLVGCLKNILQAHGITVVEDDEGENSHDDVRSVNVGELKTGERRVQNGVRKESGRRRVSFNDAHLDESWLSEHSRSIVALPPGQPPQGLLAEPARRGRHSNDIAPRLARSISSQRAHITRTAAPKHLQHPSPSTTYTSEADEVNPTLLFEPSQIQLEQNAEAFATTSIVRAARRCLLAWHDAASKVVDTRQYGMAVATARDRRTLLKQSFDAWRATFASHRQQQLQKLHWEHVEKEAENAYLSKLLRRAWTHWLAEMRYQRQNIAVAKKRILCIRYFHRWRTIAVANATKARFILTKKYLAVWRAKLARRQLQDEQATALYEENRMKKCWKAWFWHFCSRRVKPLREQRLKARMTAAWTGRLTSLREMQSRANVHHGTQGKRYTFVLLTQQLARRLTDERTAQSRHDRRLVTMCLDALSAQARLAPLLQTMTLKVTLDLQRKAFRVWHLHLTVSREATDVERKRILQSAWTSWNDTLRCKALAQRIDERVLIESLYKWLLAERLKLFRRTKDGRLVLQVIAVWNSRAAEVQTRLAHAERTFAELQQRRKMSFGMQRLHHRMRLREDADRAAIEFANSRALPNVLQSLSNEVRHVMKLNKWAADARFYTLTTRTLSVWQQKTTQHQHNRRKEAYIRVRSRIKIRLVGSCLAQWRAQTDHYRAMDDEATSRAQDRAFKVGTLAFDQWRAKAAALQAQEAQAIALDHGKLLASALSALVLQYTDLTSMSAQADAFMRDSELALLAAALKKVQWAQFTAARRAESAYALWAKNRDTHIRQMLRHWTLQAASRRTAATATVEVSEEPESPSLRPASRAASRSAQRSNALSPPPAATPAYMRTPSRSRRAGRFRALPTPVPGTPFALDPAYLATNPTPIPNAGTNLEAEEVVEAEVQGTLTPQVTPFARKLRAGGIVSQVGGGLGMVTPAPRSALRGSVVGRAVGTESLTVGPGGTAKSVRFAGVSRFAHLKGS